MKSEHCAAKLLFTLAEQILYGLEFRMQIIQQLFGGGLFFVGSGRQMLAGALDGKLFFIE